MNSIRSLFGIFLYTTITLLVEIVLLSLRENKLRAGCIEQYSPLSTSLNPVSASKPFSKESIVPFHARPPASISFPGIL